MADKDFDYGLPPVRVFGEEDIRDMSKLVWFSYVHVNGSIHTKRYMDWGDYKEVGDSTFCVFVTRLFEAVNKEAAQIEGYRLARKHVG